MVRAGTSFREHGASVAIDRRASEHVELFHVDRPEVRRLFGDGQYCDVLFVYREGPLASATGVLVELKGSHVEEAVKQLGEALTKLRACVTRTFGVERWKAVAVVTKTLPTQRHRRLRDEFDRKHAVSLRIFTTRACDLRKQGVLP